MAMHVAPDRYYARIFEGWQLPDEVLAHQKWRKLLFVDQLGWDLQHENGVEIDEFDTPRAVYCSLYLGDEIVGGWRAIRTNEEYLGKKIFPQLASLRPYPTHPDIWEVSRLGVSRHPMRALSAQYAYALMFHFALTRQARSLVGVVSLIHNRNFVINQIKTRRYGVPQVVGFDVRRRPITVFFGEIRMAEQGSHRFKELLASLQHVEMNDEALVLGRTSVSA
jgi:acyl homoserine lactone synthase